MKIEDVDKKIAGFACRMCGSQMVRAAEPFAAFPEPDPWQEAAVVLCYIKCRKCKSRVITCVRP